MADPIVTDGAEPVPSGDEQATPKEPQDQRKSLMDQLNALPDDEFTSIFLESKRAQGHMDFKSGQAAESARKNLMAKLQDKEPEQKKEPTHFESFDDMYKKLNADFDAKFAKKDQEESLKSIMQQAIDLGCNEDEAKEFATQGQIDVMKKKASTIVKNTSVWSNVNPEIATATQDVITEEEQEIMKKFNIPKDRWLAAKKNSGLDLLNKTKTKPLPKGD
jgi:hypothetical protein